MEVSKGVALFFKDQIVGGYSGHMAVIAHNPTLQGLLFAHGISDTDKIKFCEFLRSVADQLDANN